MPVAVSYPGVYVQELSSGVRTIVGVGTSTAMFIGRAKMGPMFEPKRCLSIEDFDRAFTTQYAGSDLARAVKLFFMNGGTEVYVMRIADATAAPATITLRTESGADVLAVKARSPGVMGNGIRVRVDYDTVEPESTFNVEVFRWTKTTSGALIKTEIEKHAALSMDPVHPRYAKTIINQASALVEVNDGPPAIAAPPAAAAAGSSQSGRPISGRTNAIFRIQAAALFGNAVVGPNIFRISVDGRPFTDVDLSALPVSTQALATIQANVANLITGALQAATGVPTVAAAFVAGPDGQTGEDNDTTFYLRISSTTGDVRIEPFSDPSKDLAAVLMLGGPQGGLEVSRYSNNRPAPNGIVFRPFATATTWTGLGEELQTAFDTINIGPTAIGLIGSFALTTTAVAAPIVNPKMFQDLNTVGTNDRTDGIREKLAIIASAIVAARAADPDFPWTAELWGSRLAILPAAGADNLSAALTTSGGGGVNIGSAFLGNVRHYTLGPGGLGAFQTGGVGGNDGGPPALSDYDAAYKIIDKEVDLFNLLSLPRDAGHSDATTRSLWGPASVFCQKKRAFLIVDPPRAWTSAQLTVDASIGVNTLRPGVVKDHSAVFFPEVTINENGVLVDVSPGGAVAGVMARIDGTRGVWKAPAGTEADLRGVVGLENRLSDPENGIMNPKAVNALRVFPNGIVVWGARTLDGDDGFASEYKYVSIRRLALFIEESLYRGLKWVVFEPNDEPLWAQIRLNVGAFMHNLFRQGAFQGQTPREAYFVKCDRDTTTQNDRNLGIVNIVVGFAPLKPAEFVVLYLQQMAGQVQV